MQVHALNAPDSVLRLEEWQAGSHRIAVAILNNEKTLNALSLPMVEILAPQLTRWAADPEVAMLWLGGAGDRALAAGGDIQALYAAIVRNHAAGQQVDDYAERFFEAEYRLDFQLHTFPKPVLGWGHGVVMGGGLGLLSAASHRVVTERARIAMPEVTIGLFPDAGATWLLRNAEPAWAAWLGLSGAHMNQADAVALRLGQYPLPSSTRETVQQELCAVSWSAEPEANAARLDTLLRRHVVVPDPASSALVKHRAALSAALVPLPQTAAEALQRLALLPKDDDYLAKGVAAATHGCPTTVALVLEQLRRSATLSLADCFRLELVVAVHCARNKEFMEGVRALLIDKDNAPNWTYADAQTLPPDWVESYFVPPWPLHPLQDL